MSFIKSAKGSVERRPETGSFQETQESLGHEGAATTGCMCRESESRLTSTGVKWPGESDYMEAD